MFGDVMLSVDGVSCGALRTFVGLHRPEYGRDLMAVVSIPHHRPWVVRRWAFRRLLDSTRDGPFEADVRELTQAVALGGLHLELLPHSQASRIARAMTSAAVALRLARLAGDWNDARDGEFAEALEALGVLFPGSLEGATRYLR